MTRIYVGNLPFSLSESDVRELFEKHGQVFHVQLTMHQDTGRPRGYGFVAMDTDGAQAAIAALNGRTISGRTLAVSVARPRQPRAPAPESAFTER